MSAKNFDRKGRFRSKTISFRMSPQENEQLNAAVSLSGLTKQDYIIKCIENRKVTVMPNPRVYKALKTQLENIYNELNHIKSIDPNSELAESISLIVKILYGMKGSENIISE